MVCGVCGICVRELGPRIAQAAPRRPSPPVRSTQYVPGTELGALRKLSLFFFFLAGSQEAWGLPLPRMQRFGQGF